LAFQAILGFIVCFNPLLFPCLFLTCLGSPVCFDPLDLSGNSWFARLFEAAVARLSVSTRFGSPIRFHLLSRTCPFSPAWPFKQFLDCVFARLLQVAVARLSLFLARFVSPVHFSLFSRTCLLV